MPQNFEFSQAGVGKRFLAFLIDGIILGLLFYFFYIPFGSETHMGGGFCINLSIGTTYYLCGLPGIIYFLIFIFYYLILESLTAGTIGKIILGLRIVTLSGEKIDFKASFIRNLLRLIDFLPFFYLVGAIAIWTSKEKQRLGDKLAKTIVIKTISLKNLNSKEENPQGKSF
jgi:uncharacterized RDD family membrane protein YckC